METQTSATGAEILVDSIISQGVETIFGLPGLQLDYIFGAFYDRQKEVRVIHKRHEQAAAYMAFGYAQGSGRVGTCMVVPDPGVLNATAALSTAYACNAPSDASRVRFRRRTLKAGLVFFTRSRDKSECWRRSQNGKDASRRRRKAPSSSARHFAN